jgi:hypothetical protein
METSSENKLGLWMSPEAKSIGKSDGAHQNQVGLMGGSEKKKATNVGTWPGHQFSLWRKLIRFSQLKQ